MSPDHPVTRPRIPPNLDPLHIGLYPLGNLEGDLDNRLGRSYPADRNDIRKDAFQLGIFFRQGQQVLAEDIATEELLPGQFEAGHEFLWSEDGASLHADRSRAEPEALLDPEHDVQAIRRLIDLNLRLCNLHLQIPSVEIQRLDPLHVLVEVRPFEDPRPKKPNEKPLLRRHHPFDRPGTEPLVAHEGNVPHVKLRPLLDLKDEVHLPVRDLLGPSHHLGDIESLPFVVGPDLFGIPTEGLGVEHRPGGNVDAVTNVLFFNLLGPDNPNRPNARVVRDRVDQAQSSFQLLRLDHDIIEEAHLEQALDIPTDLLGRKRITNARLNALTDGIRLDLLIPSNIDLFDRGYLLTPPNGGTHLDQEEGRRQKKDRP